MRNNVKSNQNNTISVKDIKFLYYEYEYSYSAELSMRKTVL